MTFKDALKTRDFVLTAHVNLARAPDVGTLLRQGDILNTAVDAVQLTDNPGGQVHMSGLAAAALLLRAGIDPVMHMTCRDRNRVALQSDLIGAAAVGVTSVLITRGDRIPDHMKPKVRSVFDTDAKELMAFAHGLRRSDDVALLHDFFIGATATVFAPPPGWAPVNLVAKADAGANYEEEGFWWELGVEVWRG